MTATEPKMWKTKEGELIPVTELKDSHLINCLRMLFRQLDMISACDRIKMLYALSAAADKWGGFEDSDADDCLRHPNEHDLGYEEHLKPEHVYFALKEEAAKRGLDWQYRGRELSDVMARNELKLMARLGNERRRAVEHAQESAEQAKREFLGDLEA